MLVANTVANAVLVIATSAEAITAVTATILVLFPRFGSNVPDVPVALFVNEPLGGAV